MPYLTTTCQAMSSPMIPENDHELVSWFVTETSDLALRPAGDLITVSHTQVGEWRAWHADGADPDALVIRPSTRRAIADYMMIAEDVERRRQAYNIAADRLAELADQLRQEATLGGGGEAAARHRRRKGRAKKKTGTEGE